MFLANTKCYLLGGLACVFIVSAVERVPAGEDARKNRSATRIASEPSDARFASFDDMAAELIEDYEVPGLSIAVSYRGELVFARGYGYADRTTQAPVQPESLFRIASLSKPITAIAILQLAERQQLELDASVGKLLGLKAVDPRWSAITLEHLLSHRGGWDREQSFDPMFQAVRFAEQLGVPAPATAATVIEAMLDQPLDFDPGTRYAYSNFGYCLLGRVIEKVSGQSYETYVQQNVLEPLGIRHMRIGATRLEGRGEDEVRYYHPGSGKSVFQADLGQPVPQPYGAWYLEGMDAHGGWLASASDMAKLAAALDEPHQCPILSPESIATMFARPRFAATNTADELPAANPYYSFGWQNRVLDDGRVNHWHTGSLPGTTGILILRHDGKNLVALLNTRSSPASDKLVNVVDGLLHRAANAVTEWPK